jgi:hypothetical protein
MDRRALGLAALLTGMTAAAGCGGSGQSYPDATVFFDGGGGRGGTGGAGQKPPPMMGAGSQLITGGFLFLVGNGPTACTRQVPASGDRWCAYAAPSTVSTNGFDLWVVDVSRAATGASIRCDGTDTNNCKRLSTSIVGDLTNGFGAHRFVGDTLIYIADPGALGAVIYAWRPGWVGGRALTSANGQGCVASSVTTSALCLDNPDSTTVAGQTQYDLLAGPLPADGGPILPKLDTVIGNVNGDPTAGLFKFNAALSPDGAYAAWSARPTATGTETLKVRKFTDAAATIVQADVSVWSISPDSARWYWLKTFNYDTTGAASGTLQMAPFPGGAQPTATTLAPNVGDYAPAGDHGLLFRDGLSVGIGPLKYIADVAAAGTVRTLDTGVENIFDLAVDGSAVMYSKQQDPTTGGVDLYVGATASTAKCTLSATPIAAPPSGLLDSGGGVAWARLSATANEIEGMFTNVGPCTSTKYASNVLTWIPIADQGYVYLDDSPDGVDGTLRASKAASGALPMGTSIQTRATPLFAPLPPALPAVVYTVNANSSADGLYINASLPFTATSASDGGAGN